ncbi:Protein of unknown function [Micromonospora lupini str. Lupac 08]|uniref:Uncharacterized protein n=1 Tax=Micromonospora lupini str. Lupac 08 TaxID=1150864 RepID=I0L6D6_9ACTN|nr:Protein of unknown function [Micromonospora lupini str. Lupac 08]
MGTIRTTGPAEEAGAAVPDMTGGLRS